LQPLASSALAQLGAAAAAYAGGSALPAVTGVNVTPHGDPKGAWYFALGPNIPRDLFPRPQNSAAGARPPGGPGGPGGQGGFGGPGAAPPAFRPQVNVVPNSAPRPAFTPSPALIAAIQPFRALISCAYATVLSPDDAKARGFDIPAPGVRPPAPAPSASPGPRGGGFVDYAPAPGIFVVRPPDLGTGGGSVNQPK